MRRGTTLAALLLAAAATLVLAMGAAPATAKKKKKVATQVTLEVHFFERNENSTQRWFEGKVTAKKKKCRKGRTVQFEGNRPGRGAGDVTESDGSYLRFVPTFDGSTEFQAVVAKKTKGNTVCKKAESGLVQPTAGTPPS